MTFLRSPCCHVTMDTGEMKFLAQAILKCSFLTLGNHSFPVISKLEITKGNLMPPAN